MTKKNTRSCSHKRMKAALCAVLCSALTAMPAFATGEDNSAATTTTVWTKASEIIHHCQPCTPILSRRSCFD